MKSAIHIGNIIKKQEQQKLVKGILAILNTSAGDEVKKKALEEHGKAFQVSGVTIADSNFTVKDSKIKEGRKK